MNKSDYLDIENNYSIENFSSGSGSGSGTGNGTAFGSGSVSNARNSGYRSPSTLSQGGGRKYGSYDYAYVNPLTGSMSGITNPQPNSTSGLGIIKNGAKTGTFTGGSFGGNGKYGVGFPGIRPGSSLPASSSPSFYIKPELTKLKPKFFDSNTVQKVTLPYGHIEKNITHGIPQPKVTNKYDNVGCNFATELRGPKFPYGFDLKDKNLTGYYGNQGYGYFLNNFYWGLGPWWPVTNVMMDYPDPPFDYESLMKKQIESDYMVNTIQDQLADQFIEDENKKKSLQESEEEQNENSILKEPSEKIINLKETFKIESNCGKNNLLVILLTVLILYIFLNMLSNDIKI